MSVRLTTLKAALAELAHRTMSPHTFSAIDHSLWSYLANMRACGI